MGPPFVASGAAGGGPAEPDPRRSLAAAAATLGRSWALRGLFAVALVLFLREAQTLLAPVVIAIVLTFVLAPLVRALRRVGVPEVFGAALLVAALLGSSVPLAASLAAPAAQWWETAPQTIATLLARLDRLRAAVPGLAPPPPAPAPPPPASARAPAPPPAAPPPDPVKERIASEGVALTGFVLGRGVAFAISTTATVILLYFLLASEHWMLTRVVEAVPRRRTRALVLGGVRAAQREIGRYLFALSVINSVVGVIAGLVLWWLELPNPTLWAVVIAVLNFVPYIGPLIIVALLGFAGLASFTHFAAIVAPALAYLAIHAIEANLVSPWVVGRRLALSPVSVFLSVMFWGWLWGIAGALIAVPILIGLRSACRRSRRLRTLGRFLDGDARPPPSLRTLLRVRRPRQPPSVVLSEAVDVADARRVHVLPPGAGEVELVARPFEHKP